jgi:tRNA nucleotidyltransferase (CCA-adding enzyme)
MTRQKKVYEEVLPLVEQHMRPLALYRDQAGDSAIRRLAARVKRLDRLVRVSFADKNGRPPLVITDFPEGDWIMQRAESLSIQDSAPKPILLGRHLKSFAIAPGPQYSQILDHCYEAQLEGAFTDIQEGRIYLRSYMETLGIVMS